MTSNPLSGQELQWIKGDGPHADIVLSSRVRLARNLVDTPFPIRMTEEEKERVRSQVVETLMGGRLLREGTVLSVSELDEAGREFLIERHLASRDLVANGRGGGLVVGSGGSISLLINEEDHFRIQTILSGLQIREGWKLAEQLEQEIARDLKFAYHDRFGFLTSCPTNAGTGLRASVLIHLPGLVLTREINKVLHGISQIGLTFRGLYGEGSQVVGNFFQISNQTTLGKTEDELIDQLTKLVGQVIEYEERARRVLARDALEEVEDKVWRAYGLLCYARTLSFEELMNLLSAVRLGAAMKLIPEVRIYTLNRLLLLSQRAHLELEEGRRLGEGVLEARRAELVRKVLQDDVSATTDEE